MPRLVMELETLCPSQHNEMWHVCQIQHGPDNQIEYHVIYRRISIKPKFNVIDIFYRNIQDKDRRLVQSFRATFTGFL